MKTFTEYQTLATKVPVALRNNRERIELPVLGLQQEAGKIGTLLTAASASPSSRKPSKPTAAASKSPANPVTARRSGCCCRLELLVTILLERNLPV